MAHWYNISVIIVKLFLTLFEPG